MAPDREPGAPGDAPEDESTLADWPVAPQYQVGPEPTLGPDVDEERGAVTIAPASARRGFPAVVVLATVAALLVLAGAAAAWFATRPDKSVASSSASEPRAGHRARAPRNGGAGATSSTSTDTTDATTTEATTRTTTTTTATAARTAVVPAVVGLKVSDAVDRLRRVQLVPTIRVVVSSRPEGMVLAQQPRADANLEAGSRVELRVAKEPKPVRVALPNLVGSTAAGAKARLRALALHWSVIPVDSSRPRNTVLSQSPSPGARVAKGSTVRLTVSSGPAQVSVPDVTGLDASSARAQLLSAGFEVTVVDQPASDPSEDGTVVDQSPAGGSSAPKGSTVTITVARSS